VVWRDPEAVGLDRQPPFQAQQQLPARAQLLGTRHPEQRHALVLVGGVQHEPGRELAEHGARLGQLRAGPHTGGEHAHAAQGAVGQDGAQQAERLGDVTSQFPIQAGAGIIQVHGTAQDALGQPLPVAQVENRLVANKLAFDKNGRRTLRAGGAGKDGTLTYDAPGSINWTATYTGLDAHDMSLALDPNADQSRALWLGRNPAALTELTIYEFNLVTPGPQAPCTAPLAP
jgi:hypothetical protein